MLQRQGSADHRRARAIRVLAAALAALTSLGATAYASAADAGHAAALSPHATPEPLPRLAPPCLERCEAASAAGRPAGRLRYVARTGRDSGRGTKSRPWRTIEHALKRVGPGTRILVRGGTYSERIFAGPNGAAGAEISLQPHPRERVILRVQMILRNATHVRVRGFVFDGRGRSGTAIRIDGGAFVTFSRNEVRNYRRTNSSQAFLLDEDTFKPSIVSNRVHDTGIWTQHDHGVYCKNARGAYIANNLFYDLDKGAGIQLYANEGTGCDGSLITANTIVGNETSGIVISRGADGNVITGNIITGHVSTDTGSKGHAVIENAGIGVGNVVRNNLGFQNGRVDDFLCPSCSELSGNVVADPAFLNPAAGDFRLRAGSAAADRGVGADAPPQDHDGTPRPQGPAPDLGAFELRVR